MALAKIKCETKRSFCHLWSYESWLGPRCPWIETPVYGRLTFPAKLAGARLQLSQSKNFVHNPQGKAKQQTAWNNNNKTTKSRPVPPLNRMEPGPTVSQQGFNPFIHCHDATWKRPIKVQNLKPLSLFVFFFAMTCERIFTKTDIIESRCVTGPENILFAGASVHLSEILQAWAVKGLQTTPHHCNNGKPKSKSLPPDS